MLFVSTACTSNLTIRRTETAGFWWEFNFTNSFLPLINTETSCYIFYIFKAHFSISTVHEYLRLGKNCKLTHGPCTDKQFFENFLPLL